MQRPDIVSNEKCTLCHVPLTPETAEEHRSSELHTLRVTYRQNRCVLIFSSSFMSFKTLFLVCLVLCHYRKEFDAVKHLMDVRIIGQDQQIGDRSLKVSCRVGVNYEVGVEFVTIGSLDRRFALGRQNMTCVYFSNV